METSKFMSLKAKDFTKGTITAALTAIVTGVYTSINAGTFPPDSAGWKAMGLVGLSAGIGYILKNWMTNSNDQFMKAEQKPETSK